MRESIANLNLSRAMLKLARDNYRQAKLQFKLARCTSILADNYYPECSTRCRTEQGRCMARCNRAKGELRQAIQVTKNLLRGVTHGH